MPERNLKRVVVRESDRAQSEQRHILRVVESIGPLNRIVLAKRMSSLAAAWVPGRVRNPAVSKAGHKRYVESLKRSGLDPGYSTEEIEDGQDGICSRGRSTAPARLRAQCISAVIDGRLERIGPVLHHSRADHGIIEGCIGHTLQF